jgi:hypothetical protein
MEAEARVLLEKVTAMVEWYADNEPERLARRGIQAVLYAASDLEAAMEERDVPLSDPGANSAGLVAHDAADTSKAAALDVMPRSGTQRLAVLTIIAQSADGMTDEEIQAALAISPNSQRPRRVELVDGGWLIDTARTRPTESGNDAIVWALSDKGRTELGLV